MALAPKFASALALTGVLLSGCGAPSPEGQAHDTPSAATAPTTPTAAAKPAGMNRAQVAAARQEAEKRYDEYLKAAKSDAERKMLE
ncbi:hypothetical protein EON79_23695, partial [bacterium]